MCKRNVTVLIIALMCFSPVTGSFTVMCHNADGHVALEPAIHNHCVCPDFGETALRNGFAESAAEPSRDHRHCIDIPLTSNILISVQKNHKLPINKVSICSAYQSEMNSYAASSFPCLFSRDAEWTSFFTPLRTIVLLT